MNFKLTKQLSKYIWINGEMVAWDDAMIHVMNHSLHYAGAVFEGERAYNGVVFKLSEHSKRLLKSAQLMNIKVPYSFAEINAATKEIIEKNHLTNAYIRPLIWRSTESLGIYSDSLQTNVLIMAQESNPEFKSGLRLTVSPWVKPSEDAMPTQSKSSAHYAMLSVSLMLAKESGYDDAILLDRFDDIAECTTTNIFFAVNNQIVTPIADRFLNGITRQTVIEMAKNMGFKVKEMRLTLDEIDRYDCCFITGTSAEIQGVSEVSALGKKIKFTNNALIVKLQNEYARIVGKTV